MKVIAKNKRATFDYVLEERLLTGIVLTGPEVKSVRGGDVSLGGSFATIRNGELWLHNCHIGPYAYAQQPNYDPTMTRKLLVKKSELAKLTAAKQNGRHIVPTTIGLHGRFIKVEIGLGRSAKNRDKRDRIKKKDLDIEAGRELRRRY